MRESIEFFRKLEATHVVSLGPRCATAFNLRRFYGFGEAYPFDWWITSDAGLVGVLKNPDVCAIYNKSDMELTEKNSSVRQKKLDILFHHEFYRDWKSEGNPVKESWKDQITDAMSRTKYLLQKFINLNRPENRILFVREGGDLAAHNEISLELNRIFSSAMWCLACIPLVETSGATWKGDLTTWDKTLAELGISLTVGGHKPFDDKTEPEAEAKQR